MTSIYFTRLCNLGVLIDVAVKWTVFLANRPVPLLAQTALACDNLALKY